MDRRECMYIYMSKIMNFSSGHACVTRTTSRLEFITFTIILLSKWIGIWPSMPAENDSYRLCCCRRDGLVFAIECRAQR